MVNKIHREYEIMIEKEGRYVARMEMDVEGEIEKVKMKTNMIEEMEETNVADDLGRRHHQQMKDRRLQVTLLCMILMQAGLMASKQDG